MRFLFLGTGAADWKRPLDTGEYRRNTSTLVDGELLIDGNETISDSLSALQGVPAMLYTHSHSDHYSKAFQQCVRPARVYCEESWAEEAGAQPIVPGNAFSAAGFTVLPVTASHSTERKNERPLNYILEKDGKRVLYATDGAWLTNHAYHAIKSGAPLDGCVFDGTVGDAFPDDWRVFEHNTLPMVRAMRRALEGAGLLKAGAPVAVTHLARTLHPSQAALEAHEAASPAPLIIARDGLTLEL